jgi:DNA-binding MarR family transcriptional regulator
VAGAVVDLEKQAKARPITRHLVALSTAVRLGISEGLRARGHHLTTSITHLVPNLPPDGLGMSALAVRVGMSLQRTGQLVQQLEDDGYIERVPDPSDGRAKRVVYTRRGKKLLRDIDVLTEKATERFVAVLGAARFKKLHAELALLDLAINGPEDAVHVVTGVD